MPHHIRAQSQSNHVYWFIRNKVLAHWRVAYDPTQSHDVEKLGNAYGNRRATTTILRVTDLKLSVVVPS